MRIVCDITTAAIIQAEKTPDVGDPRPFNGRFSVTIPEMSAVELDSSSYVLPVDGGDVTSLAMEQLLVQFPMYSSIVFNPLLTAADIADLDLTATFPGPPVDITRAFVGRGAGPLSTGCMPNVVGVFAQNSHLPPPSRPGLLITDTIDIGPMTGGLGADEFMVWYRLYDFTTSDDVTSSFGATTGLNDPAVRSIVEVDQEPSGLEVWISHDDGVNYTLVDRLTPTDLVTFGTLVRVAFRNTSSSKVYLASYAILF